VPYPLNIYRSLLTIDQGIPLGFGVFQNYYSQQDAFKGNSNIPLIGTLSTGAFYLGAPLMTYITESHLHYRQYMIWIGWPVCVLSLLAASFCNSIPSLIATQGLMYSIGFCILYFPLCSIANEWWIERRGFAYGLMYCSTGITGIAIPFVTDALLQRWGYQTTLRATCIFLIVFTGPCLPLLKPRLSPQHLDVAPKTDWEFLKKPLFSVYIASNFFQGLALFYPQLFMPSYAASIGLDTRDGALLIALFSLTQAIGQFTFGWLSDGRVPLNMLMFGSSFMAALGILVIWGMAKSLAVLVVFALFYGFFASGYVVLWARMGTALTENPSAVMATFSCYAFTKGVGNVITAPISSALIYKAVDLGSYAVQRYMAIVVFSGASMVLSAAAIGVWYLLPKKIRVM
jgi:MFS family permease